MKPQARTTGPVSVLDVSRTSASLPLHGFSAASIAKNRSLARRRGRSIAMTSRRASGLGCAVGGRSGSARSAAGIDLLGEVLGQSDACDGVELALEPVCVGLLVADHLFEDGGGAVVAEVVA